MSARAQRAVEDARCVAAWLKSKGYNREAEIILRVCRSNDGYRVTLGQLWRDNMALRGETETDHTANIPDEICGDMLAGQEPAEYTKKHIIADLPPRRAAIVEQKQPPVIAEKRSQTFVSDEQTFVWCDQCDRRVSVVQADLCASPFCKAKAIAA